MKKHEKGVEHYLPVYRSYGALPFRHSQPENLLKRGIANLEYMTRVNNNKGIKPYSIMYKIYTKIATLRKSALRSTCHDFGRKEYNRVITKIRGRN